MDLNTTTTLNGWRCNCGVFVRFDEAHVCPLTQTVTSTWSGTSGTAIWTSPDFDKPMKLVDDEPPPGILADIPAMRERAERVKARAAHKDLDGATARVLACDVLSLIEALEELT